MTHDPDEVTQNIEDFRRAFFDLCQVQITPRQANQMVAVADELMECPQEMLDIWGEVMGVGRGALGTVEKPEATIRPDGPWKTFHIGPDLAPELAAPILSLRSCGQQIMIRWRAAEDFVSELALSRPGFPWDRFAVTVSYAFCVMMPGGDEATSLTGLLTDHGLRVCEWDVRFRYAVLRLSIANHMFLILSPGAQLRSLMLTRAMETLIPGLGPDPLRDPEMLSNWNKGAAFWEGCNAALNGGGQPWLRQGPPYALARHFLRDLGRKDVWNAFLLHGLEGMHLGTAETTAKLVTLAVTKWNAGEDITRPQSGGGSSS